MADLCVGGMGGMGGFGGMGGLSGMGGMGLRGGGARGSRAEPPKERGPTKEIGCKCGYSCGTMAALQKHLDRFKSDPAGHEAVITERSPSPPRGSRLNGYPGDDDDGFNDVFCPPIGGRPSRMATDSAQLECTCGYSCGTVRALQKHIEKFAGQRGHAPRT
eukprot:TRINITY_DN3533_c0_g1_i2.p1 TRINITY_DN3533_c0_g1~~TRINITY_DN3533_c0_g1_i2.p1  ORF type:complete len:161 (-),score=22.15 TRINITY_DN3533_c0_g1_i2:66-548(-)